MPSMDLVVVVLAEELGARLPGWGAVRCEESTGEEVAGWGSQQRLPRTQAPPGQEPSAFVSGRPEILELRSVLGFGARQDFRWPCMDLLASLSVSERYFWVVPYPRPSSVTSKGRHLYLLSFFHKEACNAPVLGNKRFFLFNG